MAGDSPTGCKKPYLLNICILNIYLHTSFYAWHFFYLPKMLFYIFELITEYVNDVTEYELKIMSS